MNNSFSKHNHEIKIKKENFPNKKINNPKPTIPINTPTIPTKDIQPKIKNIDIYTNSNPIATIKVKKVFEMNKLNLQNINNFSNTKISNEKINSSRNYIKHNSLSKFQDIPQNKNFENKQTWNRNNSIKNLSHFTKKRLNSQRDIISLNKEKNLTLNLENIKIKINSYFNHSDINSLSKSENEISNSSVNYMNNTSFAEKKFHNINNSISKFDLNKKYYKNSIEISNIKKNPILMSIEKNLKSKNNFSNNNQVISNENFLSFVENNKKLKTNIDILKEKIKTSKKLEINKNLEIENLKIKYTEAIENYKKELDNTKKIKLDLQKEKLSNKNIKKYFKNCLNNIIDILELLLLSKPSNHRQSVNLAENASYSIDIYDSYYNEDEKRGLLQEQIQSLLISKFNFYKKEINVDLDSEIEKIKNWNNFLNFNNKGNNLDINVSNIRLTVKNYDNDSFESLKKNNSQDFFDLSNSNQFLNLNNLNPNNLVNVGNNINININQKPNFIFTSNNYNNINNSFGIDNDNFNFIDNSNSLINNENKFSNYNQDVNNNLNFNKEEKFKIEKYENKNQNGFNSNYNSNSNNNFDSFLQSQKGQSKKLLIIF